MNIQEFKIQKQTALAFELYKTEYNKCVKKEKNKINSVIKSNLSKFLVVPKIEPDYNFNKRHELKKFIKQKILNLRGNISKDRVSYIYFAEHGCEEVYNDIFNTTFYLDTETSISERLYHINNDKTAQINFCENEECYNRVKFKIFSKGYRRFCCIKCSKNAKELENINLFNGVNKSDIPVVERSRKKKYWYQVRRLTYKNYQEYKSIINPNDLKIGLNGVDGAHQIDHIISIYEGFEKNIPVEVIASVDNLQVLPWKENCIKSIK